MPVAGSASRARRPIELALGVREVVALVGPSGCGKTTLLRIAGGLERPPMAARSKALLVAAWRERPIAALLVTHDRAEAESLADRVLVLGGHPTCIQADITVPEPLRRRNALA